MEHQTQHPNSSSHGTGEMSTEPRPTRWAPKREQIRILEDIYNSGLVNPPRDETTRIRESLERYGAVADANVFYWFQNKRSKTRRQQREIEAQEAQLQARTSSSTTGGGAIQYQSNSSGVGFVPSFSPSPTLSLSPSSCLLGSSSSSGCLVNPSSCILGSSSSCHCAVNPSPCVLDSSLSCGGVVGSSSSLVGSSSSGGGLVGNFGGGGVHDVFSFPGQMGIQEIEQSSRVNSIFVPPNTPNLHYQSGFVPVFINGVLTEVPRGPFDMTAMFGQDVVLLHSSGMPILFNEYGYSVEELQYGECYFLVSRSP